MIATPEIWPLPVVASISTKMKGWTAITSSSISRAASMTSRYSAKSVELFMMMTWALTPRTLSRNASWKPVVTLRTTVSAATPSTTPRTATAIEADRNDHIPSITARIMPNRNVITPIGELPPAVARMSIPSPAIATPIRAPMSAQRSRFPE